MAHKGTAKTPSGKVFLAELLDMEREEKEKYDHENAEDGSKQASEVLMDQSESQIEDLLDEQIEDDPVLGTPTGSKRASPALDKNGEAAKKRRKSKSKESSSKSKANSSGAGDNDDEEFQFHKKTRVAQTVTPQALILSLHYGSGSLLLKCDEFKVS